MFKSIHEECGVVGIFEFENKPITDSIYFTLQALQHRGQESAGIAVCESGVIKQQKGLGLVNDVFKKEKLDEIKYGNMAIGHVRYSTTGLNNINNVQPLVIRHIKGNLALAHNGNLTNANELRQINEMHGAIFHGSSDTESILYCIVRERIKAKSIEEAIENTMYKIKGAYSCVAMSPKKIIAFRDPNGFRPLSLGKTKSGGYIVCSETCAIDSIGGEFIRDILPGEIIVISDDGVKSILTHQNKKNSFCIFEYIYFARPDSILEGTSVHKARVESGRLLAKESPVDADIVIGVPDSGLDAALGYSIESKIPYTVGFVKNKYIGRSFIMPEQELRENMVNIKLNVIKENIKGKRVVLIDDSIVRGTTIKKIINLLKDAGASEVHVRIPSPPFRYPCYFGTDIDSKEHLIANKCGSIEEIKDYIGATSLAYISTNSLKKIAINSKCGFCMACFTGKYPVSIPTNTEKNKFEEKITR
ncbi:MAG: amidophosphoribosyltransferase [Acholeplasmatales bacterium]|nr:amidophosphoribosyltransferase [Acholeplasmatales bacterium]